MERNSPSSEGVSLLHKPACKSATEETKSKDELAASDEEDSEIADENDESDSEVSGVINAGEAADAGGFKEEDEKPFACPFHNCSKSFRTQSKLTQHVRSHTGERPYACDVEGCGRKYLRSSHLRRHALTHTNTRSFACDVEGCRCTFYTNAHLQEHLERHAQPKPFACTHEGCTDRFTKHNQLKRHMCVHVGGLPYVCSVLECGKGFQFPSALKRHVLSHNLSNNPHSRSFVCGIEACGQSFATSKELSTHLKDSHSVGLVCEDCGKKFSKRHNMLQHTKTVHSTPMHFGCTYEGCHRTYSTRRNLMQHIRAKHEGALRFVCELPAVIKPEKPKPSEKKEFSKKRSLWESTDEVLPEEFRETIAIANSALPALSVISSAEISSQPETANIKTSTESTSASTLPVVTCGKAFGFKQQLQRHQARIHKIGTEPTEAVVPTSGLSSSAPPVAKRARKELSLMEQLLAPPQVNTSTPTRPATQILDGYFY